MSWLERKINSNFKFFAFSLFILFLLESFLFGFKLYKLYSFQFYICANLILLSIFSFIFGRKIAFFVVVNLFVILFCINQEKYKNTSEPIGFYDLIAVENFSVIGDFFTVKYVLLTIFIFFVIFVSAWKIVFRTSFKDRVIVLFVCLVSVLLSLPAYVKLEGNYPGFYVSYIKPYEDKIFNQASWNRNISRLGILNHLYLTFDIKVPSKNILAGKELLDSTHQENRQFNKFRKNIFFIKCESCWDVPGALGFYDELVKNNFTPLDMISPSYGGNTANVGFEVLTAMPAKSALDGVIYQSYADLMLNDVPSLPSLLNEIGYQSVAFHNYYENFWRRKIVLSKFGFARFDGLESMPHSKEEKYNRDYYLYDHVLNYFKDVYQKKNNFIYMINVRAHGPYRSSDGDSGSYDGFKLKMNEVAVDFFDFFKKLKAIDDEAIVFLFADHKPELTQFFYENGHLSADSFSKMDWNEIGHVHAFYYGDKSSDLLLKSNKLPYFCFPYYFSDTLLSMMTPQMKYLEKSDTCRVKKTYKEYVDGYPEWMFANFLLK